MKNINKLFTFLFIAMLATTISAQDQGRFLEEVFDEVTYTAGDIMNPATYYGANVSVLPVLLGGSPTVLPSFYDFYEPTGDTIPERPLVMYFPTGNFLPVGTNSGVTGELTDSSVVEISTRLAKMGYVVAVMDYRKGWNPLAPSQPERAFQLINASYRGIQDARSGIRFFKAQAAAGNALGIDTTRITLWGQGTGGYITLGAATLDEFIEIQTTADPPGKFLTDLDGDPATLETMVNPAINGDIEGTIYAGLRDPMNPAMITDTLCVPNNLGPTSDFHLQVNMGGALGDTSWLDDKSIPIISFQSPNDAFAPYGSAVLRVPTTGDEIVQVQGGIAVHSKADRLGLNQSFKDANVMDGFTTGAMNAATAAGHAYVEGLYAFDRPVNMFGRNEGSPWEWWDSSSDLAQMCHPSCGTDPLPDCPTCNFDFIARLSNVANSGTQARTYIDTIIGYFAPRAYSTLDLGNVISSTEEILVDSEVKLKIAPNPAREQIRITTELSDMKDVLLFDVSGRLVQNHRNINTYNLNINRGALPPGLYIAKIRFEKGVITKKLMFR